MTCIKTPLSFEDRLLLREAVSHATRELAISKGWLTAQGRVPSTGNSAMMGGARRPAHWPQLTVVERDGTVRTAHGKIDLLTVVSRRV